MDFISAQKVFIPIPNLRRARLPQGEEETVLEKYRREIPPSFSRNCDAARNGWLRRSETDAASHGERAS